MAHAANNLYLSNGTFDTDTTSWTTTPISKNVKSGLIGANDCGATKCLQLDLGSATSETVNGELKAVVPGEFIAASAMMKRSAISGPDDIALGIDFFQDKVLLGTSTRWSYLTGPARTWGSVKVSAIAPAGATHARIVILGKAASTLTAYVDNVVMSKIGLEDKGPQIFVGRVSAAAIDSKKNALYVAASGNPATFAYYNMQSGRPATPKTFQWKQNEDFWSVVVGGDGAAYFGTASGKLYKYDDSKDEKPELVHEFKKKVSGMRTIWSLKAGPGNCIYGGLSPDDTTDGFKYCAGSTTLVPLPGLGEKNVRSLAVEAGNTPDLSSVYWGVGKFAEVYKTGLNGAGASTPLLSDKDHEFAYFTDFVDNQDPVKNRLFVRLTGNANQTVVLDPRGSGPANDPVPSINSTGISGLSPYAPAIASSSSCKNTVFYTKDLGTPGSHLSSYCIDTGKQTDLAIPMSAAAAFAYAPSSGSGQLVSVLREPVLDKGKIVKFNLADLHDIHNKATPEIIDFAAPKTAAAIRTLAVHGDTMYSSGYVNGAIGIANATGIATPPVVVPEYFQSEGMAVLRKQLYIGGYPGAVIKSFEITAAGLGSGKLVSKELGETYGQNRPFAMLALESRDDKEADRLVIATVPKETEQAALAVYSVGAVRPWDVLKDPIPGQSILALTRIDDVVYGGTSVWRGLKEKGDGVAKLFAFNPYKTLAVAPAKFDNDPMLASTWSKKAVTAMLTVNRQIWVLAENTVLIYDHDTKKFVNELKLGDFKYDQFDVAWNAGSMVESNGYVYISATDTKTMNLYRVNISKPAGVEVMRTGASGMLKVDAKGNVYFINEEKVMKYNMALQ